MPNRRPIDFECTACLTRVSAPAEECGNELGCPKCGSVLIVPSRSIDLNFLEDVFASMVPVATESILADLPDPVEPEMPIDIPNAVDIPVVESQQKPNPGSASEPKTKPSPAAKNGPSKPKPVVSEAIQDGVPLEIDGLDDTKYSTVFGISCTICETRIHVRPDKIGKKVECPVCYSLVLVADPKEKFQSRRQSRAVPPPPTTTFSPKFGGDEIQLSPPVERPSVDVPVDPSFGLAPVTEDLLAPKPRFPATPDHSNEESDSIPLLEIVKPTSAAPSSTSSSTVPSRKQEPSRRERYEAAQRRQVEGEKPSGRWLGTPSKPNSTQSPSSKSKSEPASVPSPAHGPEQPPAGRSTDRTDDENESKNSLGDFVRLAAEMFASPGLRWRAVVATLLIGGGSAIMHFISRSYLSIEEPGMGNWILNTLLWSGFGGGPYALGTLLLWFVCGYVFRESAMGNRQVSNWSASGTSEIWSTMLVFGFSFLIAGLPLAFFSFLVMPLRCLAAPPLLLSAWYSQHPFSIVAVDAFRNVNRDLRQWRSLYKFLAMLAGVSLFAGLLMIVSVFILSAVTSLIGAAVIVLISITFATATGWHCGQVVRRLEKSE